MTDLTRAIAEALGCEKDPHGGRHLCEDYCKRHMMRWYVCERRAERIATALAPLIEALVREARAEALTEAAEAWTQGAWASTPRHKDRVADRMAAAQYAGDWLRERAEEVRR